MDEYTQKLVDENYDKLLAKALGGYLFGFTLDPSDPKKVAFAFYLMGQMDGMHLHRNVNNWIEDDRNG